MVKRSSAEALRLRSRKGMRRGNDMVLVNPHAHPERGGVGYLPRERQRALDRHHDGIRGAGLGMSESTVYR